MCVGATRDDMARREEADYQQRKHPAITNFNGRNDRSDVRALEPWRLVHAYGVFPPHTAPGLKIVPVVEGWDGQRWRR